MGDAAIQRALPGYDVGDELGRGAMGEVLSGRHRKLERDVAIKRLPRAFSHDQEVRARFGTEARVLAGLSHPHIVPVYDYVEEEGLCLLVMQALSGGTVWDRFRSEGLSMPAACAVGVAACAGLQHAHGHQVLHRDIKPENLMFDGDRTLLVTDFGIAAVLGGDETVGTLDGEILGTPAYMAPEQAQGQRVGPAADVYAAGTMVYELLSGRLPFSEDGEPLDLLRRRLHEDPAPLARTAPDVPPSVADAVMRSLARDAGERHPSAEDFGVALASAAAEAWGPSWLEQAEIRVLAEGTLAAATSSAVLAGAGPTATSATTTAPAPPGDRRETLARGEAAAPSPARPTVDAPTVRPTRGVPAATTDLRAVDPRELVPIRELLQPPPPPVGAMVAAVAAALALLLVVVLGVGSSAPSGDDLAGVTVAGQSLPDAGTVEVDLGQPIPVSFDSVPTGATDARLTVTALGLTAAGTDTARLNRGPGGSAATTLWARSARVITPGDLTAELELLDRNGSTLDKGTFTVRNTGSGWASVSGLGALALLVVALAYLASTTKPLRLGRWKLSALVGTAVIGGAVGVALSLAAWTVLGPQPTVAGLSLAAALGALAAGLTGWVVFRLGRRRRLARALGTL